MASEQLKYRFASPFTVMLDRSLIDEDDVAALGVLDLFHRGYTVIELDTAVQRAWGTDTLFQYLQDEQLRQRVQFLSVEVVSLSSLEQGEQDVVRKALTSKPDWARLKQDAGKTEVEDKRLADFPIVLSTVHTSGVLSDVQRDTVKLFLTGQFSDGWGENGFTVRTLLDGKETHGLYPWFFTSPDDVIYWHMIAL